jgi:hypothetical protein
MPGRSVGDPMNSMPAASKARLMASSLAAVSDVPISAISTRPFLTLFVGTFAEANARAAAVLVDEFDACGFDCAPNDVEGRATRLTGNYAGPNRRLGFAALQSLLKRHANKTLIGNPLFFCPAAHGV